MQSCTVLQIADFSSLKQYKLLEPHLIEHKTILNNFLFLRIVFTLLNPIVQVY